MLGSFISLELGARIIFGLELEPYRNEKRFHFARQASGFADRIV